MRARTRFDASLLHRVLDFECGDDPWQRDVADYIKTPLGFAGAAQAVEEGQADAWLYETDAGEVIGYATLVQANWYIRHPNEPRFRQHLTQVLACVGVRSHFWGVPEGTSHRDCYAWQIADDVMAMAKNNLNVNPILYPGVGAQVLPENGRALAFLQRYGFVVLSPKPKNDYLRLLLPLRL
jgi:hypothetical protein